MFYGVLIMSFPIKIQQKIRDAVVELCKAEATKIMEDLVIEHPEWTPGKFTNSNRGTNQYGVRATMKFGFENNEEADAIENGAAAKPFSGTFTQNVSEHTRDLNKPKTKTQKISRTLKLKKKRSATVKKHTRTYKNMRPVKLASGEWRILSEIPAQKKKQPLYKGISKVLAQESYLASQLKRRIKI
tara:strand:+ start:5851 stop:6408 length:558 start_codon:yes stop_codon:yes gene_type:complete